ncbi:MAG: hypothetical protein ACI9U2_000819 [Bradymonadia bacterium]|jgi:hypothetical protein
MGHLQAVIPSPGRVCHHPERVDPHARFWESPVTEPAIIAADRMNKLTDQLWRRLGISETFDRLLVGHIASEPGTSDELKARATEGMGAGAAKFFGLTFDKIIDSLLRREVILRDEDDDVLGLNPAFAVRVDAAIDGEQQGISRVEPTPGVTQDDLKDRAAPRAPRSASSGRGRATHSRETAARATAARVKSAQPRARKASKETAEGGPAKTRIARTTPARKPTAPRATMAQPRQLSAKELFNTRKLNRLLDSLDAPLFKDQVGRKLELRAGDLERFLEVTAALDIVRMVHDGMVELHWRGRELARTTDGDRRMALVGLVRELREQSSTAAAADEEG